MTKYDRDRGGLTQAEFAALDYMYPTIDAYRVGGGTPTPSGTVPPYVLTLPGGDVIRREALREFYLPR